MVHVYPALWLLHKVVFIPLTELMKSFSLSQALYNRALTFSAHFQCEILSTLKWTLQAWHFIMSLSQLLSLG
jgi:hypothetical protein